MTKLFRARVKYATINYKVTKEVFDASLIMIYHVWTLSSLGCNPSRQIEFDIQDQRQLEYFNRLK